MTQEAYHKYVAQKASVRRGVCGQPKMLIILWGRAGRLYWVALRAAQLEAKVTVIEDTEVGGTCLNRGCIPTVALIASAEAIDKINRAEEYGIEIVLGEVISQPF